MKTAARIAKLGALSRRWLDRRYRFRRLAVRRLVGKSGFAPGAAEAMLDALFGELTAPKLRLLVRAEAGSPKKLDAARGPRQITHVLSGNIPNPGVQSVILGLLVRSLNVVKPSSRDEGIVDLYRASLRPTSRILAGACRILAPSDRVGLRRAIRASDLVVAYGSDETVAAVRAQTGPRTKFVGYGSRVSFALVMRSCQTRSVARRTALDVWMADRRGCLSPSLVLTQQSAASGRFLKDVLAELARLEKKEGKARADIARSAAIRAEAQEAGVCGHFFALTPRGRYFVKASALDREGWRDGPGADIRFFRSPKDVFGYLRPFGSVLQAVSLECPVNERAGMSRRLAAAGFNRITRAGLLQFPPITWPHDGRPNFSDWLTWDRSESGRIRG